MSTPARFRPSRSVVIGGLLLAVFTTGFATAADPKTEINACASKATGAVRLIDPGTKGTLGKCRKSERGVEWSVSGPQGVAGTPGVAGAQGLAGAPGAPGEQGPAGAQGVAGVAGAKGANGDRGPIGVTGMVGPAGPIGTRGATGPSGARGATGPVGAQGARGATGPAGAAGSFGGNAPAGLTQVGVINIRRAAANGEWLEQPITFPAQIPGGLTAHIIGGPAGENTSSCPGSASAPTASPGHLCVYISIYSVYVSTSDPPGFVDPVQVAGTTQTKPFGTILRARSVGGDSYLYGVWAAAS